MPFLKPLAMSSLFGVLCRFFIDGGLQSHDGLSGPHCGLLCRGFSLVSSRLFHHELILQEAEMKCMCACMHVHMYVCRLYAYVYVYIDILISRFGFWGSGLH